ncbi:MAG TPA: hypothetical protein VKR06_00965 [Ktedonosporobacter sp.]|nr:hypothetical protein [Ktedonosporobacter sp.]
MADKKDEKKNEEKGKAIDKDNVDWAESSAFGPHKDAFDPLRKKTGELVAPDKIQPLPKQDPPPEPPKKKK